ncbi:hypothetical protein [Amycolatopsis sp. RTGN1]|uniref:hypothetical protein n=1 Tax=Amycolatopsis ponsaeliensis TaxID=2992142 RepID=UPI00254F7409|nr:hypothetical protein [Amycolatopsis sp. RTGN1]
MGTDWEGILGADDAAEAWDLAVADVLYPDHSRAAPGQPADPGDEEPFIPIDEAEERDSSSPGGEVSDARPPTRTSATARVLERAFRCRVTGS